jgi:hypothetical protein
MKVPIYRSKGELTTKSGSIFNPGVSVPYQLAAGPSQAADAVTNLLGDLSSWAVKKQDLADETEATKAKAFYENELQSLRNSVLFPRDEKNERLGINLYQLDTKTRELYWAAGKRMLRGEVARDYGSKISGKTARSALGVDLDTVDLSEDNKFNNVINKRILQQAAAATFVREDERLEQVSQKLLPLARRKQIEAEQEQDWRRQVAGGLQTAAQIDARRDKFRIASLANVIDRVSRDHAGEQGVIKRSWLKLLQDDAKAALQDSENAYHAWINASAEERRELLDDMHKTRNRQLDIANAEAKREDRENEGKVEVLLNRLYGEDDIDERKKIFGELEHLMRNNPGASDITALNKARTFAFTGESDRFGDNTVYENLFSRMRDIELNDEGDFVPVVTRSHIMNAKLTTDDRRSLLAALRTAKNERAQSARRQIKNAAGLVGDIETALFDDDESNTAVMTVVATAEAKFDQWYQFNRDKNQAEILAKGKKFAAEVSDQVNVLFVDVYEKKKRRAELRLDFKELLNHSSVGGNIEKLFDENVRDAAIHHLMKTKPKTKGYKIGATWRKGVINNIRILKTLARQAGVKVQ